MTPADRIKGLIVAALDECGELDRSLRSDEYDAGRATVGLCHAMTALAMLTALRQGIDLHWITAEANPKGTE